MKRKILSLGLALSMLIPMAGALAYDQTGVNTWMENNSTKYKTVEEIDNDREQLMQELKTDYECAETEAEEIFKDFRDNMVDLLNQNDNETDEPQQDQDGENTVKPENESIPAELMNRKSILAQLKVITNEDFDYKEEISRGIFAEYVANMINFTSGYSEEKGYYSFNDVDEENEYYHAIASLINKGAVVGVGEGLFMPENGITLNQACAILVRLSGYDVYKMPDDENDSFYWYKAEELKLLNGVSDKRGDILTGSGAVTLLYNLLHSKVVKMSYDGKNAEYTADDTFLDKYMNLDYAEEVVTANSKTSLKSGSEATAENSLKIGNNVYSFQDAKDLDSYLGKRVRVYFDKDEETAAKAIAEKDKYNSYVTVSAKDIEKYDTSDKKLYYELDGKTKHESIYLNTDIIFNGVAVDYETNIKAMLTPDVGEVTFIDNNRDGKADVVFIKSYVYYLAGILNTQNPVIYDEFGIQPKIDLAKKEAVIFKDGEAISVSELASGWVLMALVPRVDFKTVNGVTYMYADIEQSDDITFEAASKQVGGEITSYRRNDGEVRIDNSTYAFSKWLEKTTEVFPDNEKTKLPSVNSNVSAVLDKYDNIIYFTVNSSSGIKYGYVKKLVLDEEADNETYIAKIFTQDGEHIVATLADKVKVYKKWDENAKLTESSYCAKTLKAHEVAILNGAGFSKQLVKYALNNEGKIKTLYIADSTNTVNTLARSFDFYVGKDVFMKSYSNVGSDTKVNVWNMDGWFSTRWDNVPTVYFKIPRNPESDDDYQAAIDDAICGYNNVEYYDVTEAGEVQCVVGYINEVAKEGKMSGDESLMVISKAPEASWDDKKEEIVYTIEAYAPTKVTRTMKEGTFRSFTFESSNMVSFAISTTGKERYSRVPVSELKVGDIIAAYTGDTTNVICGYMVLEHDIQKLAQTDSLEYQHYIFMPSESSASYEIMETVSSGGSNVTKGKVIKAINNKTFYIDFHGDFYFRSELKRESFSKDMVVIYDWEKDKVYEGTYSDIRKGDYILSVREALGVIVRP